MSLPFLWRKCLKNSQEIPIINEPYIVLNDKIIPISTANSKIAYIFYTLIQYKVPSCIGRWLEIFPDYNSEKQKSTYTRTFKITRETKLQSFQYQILNRNIHCKKKHLFQRNFAAASASRVNLQRGQ